MNLNHVDKQQLKNNNGIVFIKGENDSGESVFAYIEMTYKQIKDLKRDIGNEAEVNFNKYGNIILSGTGQPSPREKEHMEIEYSFEHE